MDTLLMLVFGLPLAALFLIGPVEKKLASNERLLDIWHFLFRSSWGVACWVLLLGFSIVGLKALFPNQPANLWSGDWIAVAPTVFWGSLIGWIVLGKRRAREGDSPNSTVEGRIDTVALAFGRALKYGALIALACVALVGVILGGVWVADRIAHLPPSTAIIVGAIIIACAVSASRRQ